MTFIKNLLNIIKKLFTFNIATLLFGALFIYMLITVLLYITSTHVTSYQVTAVLSPGTLSVQHWRYATRRLSLPTARAIYVTMPGKA
ncbi:MAG: hypothetical protein ACLRMZ_05405 [Blautia marasmi]